MKKQLRIVYETLGGHTHMAVFSGTEGFTLGKAGDLCLTNEEFQAWKNGAAKLEFVARAPIISRER